MGCGPSINGRKTSELFKDLEKLEEEIPLTLDKIEMKFSPENAKWTSKQKYNNYIFFIL